MIQRSLLLALAAIGCAHGNDLSPVRFANAPAVHVVDDRRDVRVRPARREFMHDVYHYDGILQRRLTRALELPRPQRAVMVNSLDEVPDSTWFINRIGTHELSPDEIMTGPVTIDSPELHFPWTVKSTKVGGTSPGFIIADARGVKYLIKFDAPAFPEMETAAHVVVNRLLWACGYNVPEDLIVYVRPGDVVIAPDAEAHDRDGRVRHLDRAEVQRILAGLDRTSDGRIRAMASRWLDGKPLGGHPAEGVRGDDSNDRIAHQLRRDLRGAYTIFAWLDHVDVQEGNFLDMWVADRANATHHYVKHYLIDFGKSLGVMATTGFDRRRGHTYLIDFADMFATLATGGLLGRDWEHRVPPDLPGVALFDAGSYDPATWHPDSPAYVPFLTADRIDKAWGARIVARFTRAQLAAAVAAGRYSDPRSATYVTDTLVARQRVTAAYWFTQASALDAFTLNTTSDGVSVCFDDLAIVYDLASSPTRYTITRFAWDGSSLGSVMTVMPGARGHTCTAPLAMAGDNGGYTIVSIATQRSTSTRTILVHIAREPNSGTPRIIGLWRE